MLRDLTRQADACRELGSPMYGDLLDRMVADLEAGGVTAAVLAGHEEDPGPSALGLRLLGSVHRLVLERRAAELAAYYPSVGGTWEAEGGWRAFQALLRDQPQTVREWLDRPPQTNEVGRSTALYGGLLQLPDRLPVRLFEIGSSGGLNLRADRYTYVAVDGTRFGSQEDGLVLHGAWRGRELAPRSVDIVERLGSDLMPVDVSTTEGRLALTAYVWPDQTERFERLRKALAIAQEVPAEVRGQSAAGFVQDMDLMAGTTTVLWHSVMFQYVAKQEQEAVLARIAELGAAATEQQRFAHLVLEPMRRTPDAEHEFLVVLQTWPGGVRRILGEAAPHGVPVVWDGSSVES